MSAGARLAAQLLELGPARLDRAIELVLDHLRTSYEASVAAITIGRRDESASLGWSPVVSLFPANTQEPHLSFARRWYAERDLADSVQIRRLLEGTGTLRSQRVRAVLTEDEWESSVVAADIRALGGRDRLVGGFPVSDCAEVYVVLDRAESHVDFSNAEEVSLREDLRSLSRFAHWLCISTGVLFGARPFSQRERQVCAALLEGSSEKQIAAAMELKPSYVHQIVVRVYRKLRVQSRAEFMALWIGGDEDSINPGSIVSVP